MPFVGEDVFHRRQQKRTDFSLAAFDLREAILFQQQREEFLGKVGGGVARVPAASHVDVKRGGRRLGVKPEFIKTVPQAMPRNMNGPPNTTRAPA